MVPSLLDLRVPGQQCNPRDRVVLCERAVGVVMGIQGLLGGRCQERVVGGRVKRQRCQWGVFARGVAWRSQ